MPRHPNATREQIEAALRAGKPTLTIATELRVDRGRVRRIRNDLNLPAFVPAEQTRTPQQKWATYARTLNDGHMEWTGERVGTAGTPVMRYKDQCLSPTALAFELRHGRPPQGYTIADCGLKHCIAPDHVNDEPGRLQARRALHNGGPRKPCSYGHDQNEHGKFDPTGRAYCGLCKALHKQERRDPLAPRRERTRPRPTSLEDVFHAHIEEVGAGHVRWAGPVMHRTPAVKFDGRTESAFRVAFRLCRGRDPEGLAMPTCGVPLCVAGGHLEDRPMRQLSKLLFESIFGEAS